MKNRTDSRKQVALVRRFVRTLETTANAEGYRPRQGYATDWVLLALLSKSVWVARSICLLVASGYPEEAFGSSRTLIDIFFTVRYICNKDSDERAKLYVHYFAKEIEKWKKIQLQHYPAMQLGPRPDQLRIEKLAKKFKSPNLWSGHSTRYLAEEPDTIEVDPAGKPTVFSFDYE